MMWKLNMVTKESSHTHRNNNNTGGGVFAFSPVPYSYHSLSNSIAPNIIVQPPCVGGGGDKHPVYCVCPPHTSHTQGDKQNVTDTQTDIALYIYRWALEPA